MDSAATLADEASDKLTMETGMKNYATPFKPGRKFGLTGQRQQQQQVFNTLTNSTSSSDGRRMSVRDEQRNSWMYSLSEQEMEDKYNAICLAIRTENLTLGQRLEHQHAERDLVENNLSQEVKVLHSLFLTLKQEVARSHTNPHRDGLSSGGWNEIFIKVANQLDAVHSSANRISSSAESLGAVEYEARLSAAVQVLILYVDHIKRKWEKEHHELEETKRILKESGVNVAQCLAALPDRLQASGNVASTSGPVSKRRASFPAAPLRRISLKPPPLAGTNARVSTLLEPLSSNNDPVSAITIAEEREDADSDHPPLSSSSIKGEHPHQQQQEVGKVAPIPPPSSALVNLPSPAPPTSNARNGDKGTATASVSVTTRRRVGGLKSHSWSSSHTTSGLLDRRESSETGRAAVAVKPSWLSKAGQWTHLTFSQWRKTAATYRTSYGQHWTTLRQKRLQLLRYSASACFLLAALVSLVVTFVPSSSPSSPSSATNATVMPSRSSR